MDHGRRTPHPHQPKVVRSHKIQAPVPPPEPDSDSSYFGTVPMPSRSGDERRKRDDRSRSHSSPDTPVPSSVVSDPVPSIARSHTPGHLSSKSQGHDRRHKPSELSIRQRSQSSVSISIPQAVHISSASTSAVPVPPPSPSPHHGAFASESLPSGRESPAMMLSNQAVAAAAAVSASAGAGASADGGRRPSAMRSASTIVSKPSIYGGVAGTSSTSGSTLSGAVGSRYVSSSRGRARSGGAEGSSVRSAAEAALAAAVAAGADPRTGIMPFPPLVDAQTAPDVQPAPSSGMYWSRAPVSGVPHTALRAHTSTLIGSSIFIFGGCDTRTCFNDLYVLDADSFFWWKPTVVGDIPLPLRAMTCTAVGKKLVVFGGGDGPEYYSDVYVLDTTNFRWSRPRIATDRPVPSKRRAHTACLYKNGIYVFGGGDGVQALNDVWRLDVSDMTKMSWKLISAAQTSPPRSGSSSSSGSAAGGGPSSRDMQPRPKARGYHTANMVGSKLVIYGGSDGGECFNDVWVYDVDTRIWRAVGMPTTFRRLSHTATIIGSYLFVVGGHDGTEYSNEVLLLNLVTMVWDRRKVYGLPPSGRGYHSTVLHDSRLLVIGGFDGGEVFGDVWILELAVHAYYSQISQFTVNV